jgi:hypothetical protein
LIDPLGLSGCAASNLPRFRGKSVKAIEKMLRRRGFTRTQHSSTGNQTWTHSDGSTVKIHPYGDASTKPWKTANNGHIHKYDPHGGKLDDRGISSTSMGKETHIGIKNPSDLPTVRNRPHGAGTL